MTSAGGHTFVASGCDVFISVYSQYGGLHDEITDDAYHAFGVGFNNAGQSIDTTLETTSASYTIRGNSLTTDSFTLKLTAIKPGAVSNDVIQLYTCANFVISPGPSYACATTRSFQILVALPIPTITSPTLPGGAVGSAYNQTVGVSGGVTPYNFAVTSGALPTGLNLNAATGAITGTPTVAGPYNFSITVTGGGTDTQAYTVNIVVPIAVAPTTLPNGQVGASYSQTLSASGGATPYAFTISGGALPAGLTLDSNGTLHGTPTSGAAANFTVTATDAGSATGFRAYSMTPAAATVVVDPTAPTAPKVGVAYTTAFTASGGTAPYAFTHTGNLPNGLTLAGNGTLSGTPTGGGPFNFTIRATDSSGGVQYSGQQAFTVTVDAPTIIVAPTTLTNAQAGVAYTTTITASGGTGPYTFTAPGGGLPPGITLAPNGTLSGTATSAGTFNFSITTVDSSSGAGPFNIVTPYTLVVAAPSIVVAPAALPAMTVGTAFSQTITSSGGTGPYAYTVTSGALPAGLNLAGGGLLSGTPTAGGPYSFTVTATDSTDGGTFTGTRSYSGTIAAPTIALAPVSLPMTVGQAVAQTIVASGGTGSYTYAVTAGSLPSGVSLAGNGALSGAPTSSAAANFTITATDSSTGGGPYTGFRAYSVTPAAPAITVNPTTLTPAQVGTAYSATITATGGVSPHAFAITAGSLPPGVTLTTGGALTGTSTAGGTFNFTVTATDNATGPGAPFTGFRPYTLTVSPPSIVIAPTTLPGGTAGTAYSQTLSSSGGTSPYSYAPTAGTLPPGIALSSGGTLSGSPTAAGTFNFTISATDSSTGAGPYTAPRAYSVTISAPTITFTPTTLTGGTATVPYPAVIFTGSGGVSPYTYALTAGALPAGMTISSAGLLSGTPAQAAAGSHAFDITATDANGFTRTNSYTLNIAAVTLVLPPPPAGVAGTPYSHTLTPTGGTGPYSFAPAGGALPPGINFNAAGVYSGTPTAAGTFNSSVAVTDANGATGSFPISLVISAPTITFTPTALTGGTATTPYPAVTFAGSGGVAPYSYAMTAGALPSGMTLNGAGVLSGTPVQAAAGSYTFDVTATDANGFTRTNSYTLNIAAVTLVLPPPPAGVAGTAYSHALAPTGGTGPYSFAPAGGALPPGINFSGAGVFSGTPTAAGTFNFTVAVTDANGATGSFPISLVIAAPIITFTPTTLADGTATAPYPAVTFTGSGGVAPYSFAPSGALPAGLTVSGAGVLSGTPAQAAAGSYTFDVTATDANGFTRTNSYTLNIAAVTLVLPPPPAGVAGTPYSHTLAPTGGTGPYSFAPAGAVPPGMNFNGAGVFSGTPTAAGTFNLTVTVTDANGATGSFPISLVIAAPTIAFTPTTLADGTATTPYPAVTFAGSGGVAPYSFTLTAGALPAGMAISGAGVLSGTPIQAAAGSYTFDVTAADANGFTRTNSYTLNIAAVTLTVSSAPAGAAGVSYSHAFAAGGGTAPYAYALTGALPAGLGFTGGQLSGAPTEAGVFPFTVTVTDANGASAPFAQSVTIAAPVVTLSPASLAALPYGQAFSQTFTPGGGVAPYALALSGALPTGLTFNPGSGTLSGSPTQSGSFPIVVTATDSTTGTGSPFTATRNLTLVVDTAPPPTAGGAAGSVAANTTGGTTIDVSSRLGGVYTDIAIATAPSHGTATISGLTITYTPATDFFGTDAFTYVANGPGGTSAPATVTVTVTPLAVPTAQPKTAVILAGQPATIAATEGATGGPITGVAVAAPPASGTTAVSGQTIVYTPAAGFSGSDSFTYTLSNAFGTSTPATVTITVNPAPVTAPPVTIEILAGQVATVDLTAGATGGPFIAAAATGLTPSTAGTTAVSSPSAGSYRLTFTPDNAFAGTAQITYTLTNAFATSAAGRVTVIVTARPDPSLDPEVRGLIAAQDAAARRFATTQMSNFNRRMESLHDGGGGGGGGGFSSQLGLSGGYSERPDGLEALTRFRRYVSDMGDHPIDDQGLPTRSLDGGLGDADLLAYSGGTDGLGSGGGGAPRRWGFWAAGSADFGMRDAVGGQSGFRFTTDGLTAGADYRVSEQLAIGFGLGYGHDSSRIGRTGSKSEADSYSGGLYASYLPVRGAFIDGVVGLGALSFDSRRIVAPSGEIIRGERDGDQLFGSITAGIERRGERWLISPYGRLGATRSTLDRFSEVGGGPYALTYEEHTVRTLTGALGVRGDFNRRTGYGVINPRFRLEYTHDFEGGDDATLGYADWIGGPSYRVAVDPIARDLVRIELGIELHLGDRFKVGFDYDGSLSSSSESHGLRFSLQSGF